MTRELDDGEGRPSIESSVGRNDPERLLRREDFCDEWIATVTAYATRLGSPLLSPEAREASLKAFAAEITPGDGAWVFALGPRICSAGSLFAGPPPGKPR